MNNEIACIDYVVIGMLCLLCILENWKKNKIIGSIYLWLSYLIINYVLSLVKHIDKYYFNYIWNLKHNRFVILQLTWMDQLAIVRNLACCQYIGFKTLSTFFSFKWELCHLVLIAYIFLCFTLWPPIIL
jgi:hypothetical protein